MGTMGMSLSCPLANLDDLNNRIESYLVRSISFGGDDIVLMRSISFNDADPRQPPSAPPINKPSVLLQGSFSFKGREMETKFSLKSPLNNGENNVNNNDNNDNKKEKRMIRSVSLRNKEMRPPRSPAARNYMPMTPRPLPDHRNQAALKLQKTYKSFRTRRQLADCAVLVEQRWWKLLDFAELKRSSVSFFAVEKPETAVSRWSRARTRAAKVGKGLSKAEKARKLALQHWLEAIDPRHRYGHNLQFYYAKWLQCESKQPFFFWLDIGEGKEVNLEKCPRPKLQQQCIKYLGPIERKAYEVIVQDGKLVYKQSEKMLDTREGSEEDTKWIFVLSVSKILYVGQKKKGTFQHSSFLAGGATLSAGRLVVEDGILKAVWPHSGHYLPTEENFDEFISFLKQHNVDLSLVQRVPTDGEEIVIVKKESKKEAGAGLRSSTSVPELNRNIKDEPAAENAQSLGGDKRRSSRKYSNYAEDPNSTFSRWSRGLHSKMSTLQIPSRQEIIELFRKEGQQSRQSNSIKTAETPANGYETADEYLSDSDYSVSKDNLFEDEEEEDYEEPIPTEKITERINSHKGMKSFHLADQLSCRWTTGAGPRIGCVRDYPSELQFRVLEEVNLSPRTSYSTPRKDGRCTPGNRTPSLFYREATAWQSPFTPSSSITGETN